MEIFSCKNDVTFRRPFAILDDLKSTQNSLFKQFGCRCAFYSSKLAIQLQSALLDLFSSLLSPLKNKLEKCSDPVSFACYYEMKTKACIVKALAASMTLPFQNVFHSPFHALAQTCLSTALLLQLCALVLTNLSNKLKEISRKTFFYGKQKKKKKKKNSIFF